TVHELRSFLGLCTYYRRFVRNFSTIARPLHKLTEAKSNFNWTEDCQKSFNSLKQALTTSPVLTYSRTNEDFILDTDASNEGIGAVLSQKIGNEECVIAYFSKSLDNEIQFLLKNPAITALISKHSTVSLFSTTRQCSRGSMATAMDLFRINPPKALSFRGFYTHVCRYVFLLAG
ncbi:retrovirus-related Pol polyprotein from transposon 297, partial [Nephila pilipes]